MKKELTRHQLIHAFLKQTDIAHCKDMSVNEIAAAAGMSRSTFYYHFPNKEAFIDCVIDHEFCNENLLSDSLKHTFFSMEKTARKQRNFILQSSELPDGFIRICIAMERTFSQAIQKEIIRKTDKNHLEYPIAKVIEFCAYLMVFLIIAKTTHKAIGGSYPEYLTLIKRFFSNVDMQSFDGNPFSRAIMNNFVFDEKVTVQKLMDSLKNISMEKDMEQLSAHDIYSHANLSKATFYRRFPNKWQLRNEVWLADTQKNLKETYSLEEKNRHSFLKMATERFAELPYLNLYDDILKQQGPDDLFYFVKSIFQPEVESEIRNISECQHPDFITEVICSAITFFFFHYQYSDYLKQTLLPKEQSPTDLNDLFQTIWIWVLED